MSETIEEKIWFTLGCISPQRELRVRDDARANGLAAFVPLRYTVKTVRGQKQRALIPAITGMIFVKGTLDELKEYIGKAHYPVYIKKSTFSNKEDYLTVPTHAMEEFIAVTESNEEHVTYFRPEEISLQAGDRIRIKGGFYDGKEGTIIRIKGKRNKHLVVQIPGILLAAVELSPEIVQLDDQRSLSQSKGTQSSDNRSLSLSKGSRERPSKDVDKDKKLLMEIAHRLLFEIPDKYQQENEYYLLLSELRRTRERLKTFKGFTPATEAELALPMYLAAVKLGDGVQAAEDRLKAAVAKLKDSSKLKAQCLEYLEKTTEYTKQTD